MLSPIKQMGPAFLPTPLSPARGHLRFTFQLANQSSCIRQRTWRPMSMPRPVVLSSSRFLAPPCFAVRHRRSHRHPTMLRDGFALFGPKPSLRVACPLAKPRPRSCDWGVKRSSSRLESPFLQLSPAGIVADTGDVVRTLLNQADLLLAETLRKPSLRQRVDSRHRIFGSIKAF